MIVGRHIRHNVNRKHECLANRQIWNQLPWCEYCMQDDFAPRVKGDGWPTPAFVPLYRERVPLKTFTLRPKTPDHVQFHDVRNTGTEQMFSWPYGCSMMQYEEWLETMKTTDSYEERVRIQFDFPRWLHVNSYPIANNDLEQSRMVDLARQQDDHSSDSEDECRRNCRLMDDRYSYLSGGSTKHVPLAKLYGPDQKIRSYEFTRDEYRGLNATRPNPKVTFDEYEFAGHCRQRYDHGVPGHTLWYLRPNPSQVQRCMVEYTGAIARGEAYKALLPTGVVESMRGPLDHYLDGLQMTSLVVGAQQQQPGNRASCEGPISSAATARLTAAMNEEQEELSSRSSHCGSGSSSSDIEDWGPGRRRTYRRPPGRWRTWQSAAPAPKASTARGSRDPPPS